MNKFDCEVRHPAVPKDCLHMGLALGELSRLVTEATYYHARRNNVVEMWKSLDGYKMYIVVWMFVGSVFVEKVMGFDIVGFDAGPDWLEKVMIALGVGAGRSAVAKM